MFECPHCGEPLDDDADSCPYCGSDAETGWNPDTDYYAVELPEDDDESDSGRQGIDPDSLPPTLGVVSVLVSIVLFAAAAFAAYSWGSLLPLFFLLFCGLFYVLGTRRS
ncbi:MAG: zinc-ribbon domain-containing protein [Planctomycetes bacterium]|nr:zinc-ribbon domain-containing protein [Planctomycetota bacterium]